MKAKLPPGTRAEKVEYARNLMRQQQLETPTIRLRRTKRRVTVAGLYVVIAATVAWLVALAANVVSGNKAFAVLYFLLGVQAIFFVVLTYSVGMLNKGDASLDERERSQRDHATALAYKILGLVVAALTIALIPASDVFHWVPKLNVELGPSLVPFVLPFLWFMGSLPMAVMAWTLADPDPES
jgi:hypothetical protein